MKWIAMLLTFALCGCAELAQFRAATRAAQNEVLTEALDSAEYLQCKRITMEIWQEKYGVSAEKIKAWRTLCGKENLTP